jgi:hypothetical protein
MKSTEKSRGMTQVVQHLSNKVHGPELKSNSIKKTKQNKVTDLVMKTINP